MVMQYVSYAGTGLSYTVLVLEPRRLEIHAFHRSARVCYSAAGGGTITINLMLSLQAGSPMGRPSRHFPWLFRCKV